MKVACYSVFVLITSHLFSQNDSIQNVFSNLPIIEYNCDKEEIESIRTSRNGKKIITRGRCFTIIGYYTYQDPPPPMYDKGKKFRRVTFNK